jgi:hypothetical protein
MWNSFSILDTLLRVSKNLKLMFIPTLSILDILEGFL